MVGTAKRPMTNAFNFEVGGCDLRDERLSFIRVESSAALWPANFAVELSDEAEASGLISLPQASQIRVKVFKTAPQWGHLFIRLDLVS